MLKESESEKVRKRESARDINRQERIRGASDREKREADKERKEKEK